MPPAPRSPSTPIPPPAPMRRCDGCDDRACSGSMTPPRIRSLQVRAVRVPMAHPHKTAGGTVEESPLVLIDITTDDGTVGHGVVFTYTAAALRPTAELVRNLEPLVV